MKKCPNCEWLKTEMIKLDDNKYHCPECGDTYYTYNENHKTKTKCKNKEDIYFENDYYIPNPKNDYNYYYNEYILEKSKKYHNNY